MSWVRFEANMPRHPKIAGRSVHAKWAFVEVVSWCVEHGTDGSIPPDIPFRTFTEHRRPDAVQAELLDAGLLEQNGRGLVVHDFSDYQPSGSDDKRRREAARERTRRWRMKREGDA